MKMNANQRDILYDVVLRANNTGWQYHRGPNEELLKEISNSTFPLEEVSDIILNANFLRVFFGSVMTPKTGISKKEYIWHTIAIIDLEDDGRLHYFEQFI